MPLIAITGTSSSRINRELVRRAAEHLPAILVDCAGCADPHRYYPDIDLTAMQNIYVFELDLLHKFRDVLRQLPVYVKRLNARIIIVTTSDHLFNYHNEYENLDVYAHAWQLMKQIGARHEIVAGVKAESVQRPLALKYCSEIKEIV